MPGFRRVQAAKRVLSFLLILALLLTGTGCGSLVGQAGPEPVEYVSAESVAVLEKERLTKQSQSKKKVIDYSIDRFNIGGVNAFYILPGLENIPDAMAVFNVLDYNSRGDFVYYYVTPCYITPEELAGYMEESKSSGIVKDRTKVTVPEGRREDYDYDAGVLMTYNPYTGVYKVIYAKAFKIDKEREFDPATEGRPFYYLANDSTGLTPVDGGDAYAVAAGPGIYHYRTFIQQRIMGCKVAGREEYLLLDQGTLAGVVYDADGNKVRSVTYRSTIDNEIDSKKSDLLQMQEDAEDEGEDKLSEEEYESLYENDDEKKEDETIPPDTMNVLITDAVMTESYESYLGVIFFLGSDLFKAMPATIPATLMVYRLSLDEGDGGFPYLSVNLNAKSQEEKWMSLDGKFFTSRSELENADGYSMEDIKTGRYGEEYKDSFSPFFNSVDSSKASFLVGMPYFHEIPGSEIDQEYAEDLYNAYFTQVGYNVEVVNTGNPFIYEIDPYATYWLTSGSHDGGADRDTWKKIKWGADNEPPAKEIAEGDFGGYVEDGLTISEKRVIQDIAANTLINKMHEELAGDFTIDGAMEYFEKLHFLPRPGEYDKGTGSNEVPSGFVKEDGSNPGLCFRSDHILNIVSANDAGRALLYPVDYFPNGGISDEESWNGEEASVDDTTKVRGRRGLLMKPYEQSPSLNRTVYVYDTGEADKQIKEMKEAASLNDEASKAVDELSLLMRTSPEVWENVKLGWFINQMTQDTDEIFNTVSKDAAKANDSGRLSDDEYEKAMEVLEKIKKDIDQRDAFELFKKAREDAKEQLDDGKISEDKYDEIIELLDEAEKEKLGLNDEDWEMFEKLVSASRLISEADKALKSPGGVGKKDTLSRIEELSKKIPEDIREGMLYLCAGFQVVMQQAEAGPLSYKVVFPDGASIVAGNDDGHETTGGRIDTHMNGVIVSAESSGEWFEGNTYMLGYRSVNDLDLFDRYTYGSPIDLSSMEYRDGDKTRSVIVLLTDKGAKFLERNESGETKHLYDDDDLEDMLGEYEMLQIYKSSGLMRKPRDEHEQYKQKKGKRDDILIRSVYTPLPFDQRGNEAYESVTAEKALQDNVNADDFKGFMTEKMLVTSTGYTRDTESLLREAIQTGLQSISASENRSTDDEATLERPADKMNERYTGHLTSAKNFCMIALDKALICSVASGTKILDLNHGTVADDLKGSYYRAYQNGKNQSFSLLGFANEDFSYLDVDLPLAKIYSLKYENGELDKAVIKAFINMLGQYAKDYLYREYRTYLAESGEIELKEATAAEKQESVEAGAIFDPANTSYDSALQELEKKYGIERTPSEIKEFTETVRAQIAGVRPAMTRLYELAGARKLAADSAKRNEGYWKGLESRMTMAPDIGSLDDILVEIRMNDEVLPELPKEQADRYRSYKSVIDLTKAHTSVSAADIFGDGSVGLDRDEGEKKRLQVSYRNEVLGDIIDDYIESTKQRQVSGNRSDLTEPEKKEIFERYLSTLLNQVNPENFAVTNEKAADEFVDLINNGKEKLAGTELEDMRRRIKEGLPDVDAVWKLEELVIDEKITYGKAYAGYRQWLMDYKARVDAAGNERARLKVPVKEAGASGAAMAPLTGKERISFLRTSPAYKEIIGDIKKDPAVFDFLKGRKITWDDYCTEVVKKAGMRVIRDDNGAVDFDNRKSTVSGNEALTEDGTNGVQAIMSIQNIRNTP